MKIVSRKELMAMPDGTIFRPFEPMIFHGDWQRLRIGLALKNDFYSSIIGPSILCGSAEYHHGTIEICGDIMRDGLFSDAARYLVLDENDISAMVSQLTGRPYEPIVLELKESDYKPASG